MHTDQALSAGSSGSRSALAALGLVAALLWSQAAAAQSTLSLSPDVTIRVGTASLVVQDEDVVVDNQLGIAVLENLGPIPAAAEVVGHAVDTNGDRLFILGQTTNLSGGIVARAGDVVRYDGASFSIEFAAASEGIPRGVVTDAVSVTADGLLLSFDTTVSLGAGLVAADEDLVYWEGGNFTPALDGSTVGLLSALDIDGAQDLGGGAFLISLDTSGSVGGIAFDDEDILRYAGSTWSLEVDTSALDFEWRAADLEALMVPEPAAALGLVLGSGSLVAMVRRGRRRSSGG